MNGQPLPGDLSPAKVATLLGHAAANLDPQDHAERVAYCQEHDQHGVLMYPSDDDDILEFRWGGRTLVVVPVDVLTGDGPLDVAAAFIAEVPDTVPDELGGPE